jgi:hypothetical protein
MRDQVFISYSHRDAAWLARLQVYLAPLERRGQLRRWDDSLIAPGQRWAAEIQAALARTRVAILLVSADFLASRFIGDVELPRLLGAAEDQGVLIIPVVLDHCNFERFPELAQFQAIHPPAQPLETLAEPAQKAVLARLAAAVADALGPAEGAGTAAPPAAPARLVGLPARNPLFVGREDLLAQLQAQRRPGSRGIVFGLAGLGKSELLIEYAHRQRSTLRLVAWCAAETAPQLIQGFGAIAAALGLPEASGADQPAAARAARVALAEQDGWLLLLDGADDAALLRDWLPAGDQGQVLISSRSAAWGGLGEAVELGLLADDEATALLLRRAGLLAAGQAASAAQTAAAQAVVGLVSGLPLALDQAGAYLEETGCSPEEYAALWQAHSRELLAERGHGGLRGEVSLWQAWTMPLAQLAAAQPATAALLHLLASLHHQDLPDAALAAAAPRVAEPLATLLAAPLARLAALRELLRLAFVRRDAKTRRLAMHPVVQHVLREAVPPALRAAQRLQAVEVVDALFPEPRFANWAECDALAGHAATVLDAAAAEAPGSPAAPAAPATPAMARLAVELGFYLAQRVRPVEALPRVAQGLAWRRVQAAAPAELARALQVLAQLQAAAAAQGEAEQSLQAARQQLADQPPSPQQAAILDRLAMLALSRGRAAEAWDWLDQADHVLQAAGAADSVEAAQCANDCGVWHYQRGEDGPARDAFARAAALRQALLPAAHPAIWQSLSNLAAVQRRLGDSDAARALHTQVLALREAALGPAHPYVAESLTSLGLLALADDALPAAREALARALAIQHACRGEPHPDVALARHALACVALAEGALDEAEGLFDAAHQRLRATLGPDHPECARAWAGLGRVALARGAHDRAAAMLRDASAALAAALGPQHREVGAIADDLARLAAGG